MLLRKSSVDRPLGKNWPTAAPPSFLLLVMRMGRLTGGNVVVKEYLMTLPSRKGRSGSPLPTEGSVKYAMP